MKRMLLFLVAACSFSAWNAAGVSLEMSKIFGDNMILQRDKKIRVWGKAPQGKTVTVTFGGKSATSNVIGSDDIWVVQFNETFSASTTGRDLVAKCSDGTSVKKTGVLVGDVWLAGGQSNMVMPLKGSAYGNTYDCEVYEKEIKDGKFPYIRMIGLGIGYGKTPQPEYYEVEGTPSWRTADTGWSAVSFHFAREIALKNPTIPIGIIGCACNGLGSGYWQPDDKGGLWNCQLAPIIRMKVRGAIWYQGETDDGTARARGSQSYYREVLERLVGGWRREFGETAATFPFYWVSLAGQKDYSTLDDPSGDKDVEMRFIREGMLRACYTITNSGMCITWDCGRKCDEMKAEAWIHPRCKNVPGARLALLARKNVYGETSLVAESPYFKSSQIDGKGNIRIKFDMHGSTGFCSAYKSSKDAKFPVATPNEPIKGFAICGVNHVWEWADVKIEGSDTLVLSSPKVPHPVYARYCYRGNPVDGIATGYNKELLPIAPFATDMTHYNNARGATQGTFADKIKAASSYDGQEAGTCYLTEPGTFVEFSNDFTLKNAVLDLQGAYQPRLASGTHLTLDNAECSYPGRMNMNFTLNKGSILEFVNGGSIWQSPIAASGTDVSLKVVSGVSRCGKLIWNEQAVGQGGRLLLNKGQLKVIKPPTQNGDPDGSVTINVGPSIEMTLPATPFEGAVLSSDGAMTINARVPLKVDATSVQVANGSSVTIPLLSSKISLSCATYANSCVTTKSGILATLKKDAQTLNLVLTANGDPSCVHTFVSYGATQAATCTEAGSQAGKKCSKCGYVSVQEAIIPPLGHAWGAWQTTCAATATADGEEQRACSRCPATETRVLPAGGGATGTYNLVKGGAWSTSANWTGVTSGLYPRLATDSAEVLKTLTSDTTLDLDGKSYAIKAFNATNLSCNLTLKNGSLTFADASYLRVTAAKTLTLENMNLTSTTTSSDYKAHALDPYTSGALIAFKGTNTLSGILLRNYNSGVGYSFKDGLTTSDSGFNFGSSVSPFTLSLENARFSTPSMKLETGTVAISVKLGANNTTETPVLNFNGLFQVPAGSTLTIDATSAAAGRYEIIHANQFSDTAEFAGKAVVTVASGMSYEMETVPNGGIYLTLTGGSTPPPEPPEDDPEVETIPLSLSTYFQNKMIFQRGAPIKVWGKVTPKKTVSVRFGNGAAVTSSAANTQGIWEATLPAQTLSATGQSLVVTCGSETKTITDILVGDVYLCSGQSNMEFAMKTTYDYQDFQSDATTQIRYCRVKQSYSAKPESHDLPAKSVWNTATEVFDTMSATAFYFARAMRRAQPSIPIGLVDNSYGGHRIEGFMSPEMVADSTSVSNAVATMKVASVEGETGFMNWNTMYEPLRRVSFKAQLFWQGCSNGDINMAEATYENYLTRFVNGVRQVWGENLPFYNVQLASNYSWSDAPGNADKYTKIRDAQFSVFKKLAHTGLVPTVDLFAYDFHPKSKILVGERLARWVRRDLFGENIQAQSPTVETTTYDSGSGYARVTFDSATCGNGLVLGYKTWTDKNEPVTCASLGISTNLNGFAVSTDNKNWYWADEAMIESANTVLLKSSKVSAPKYVRFAQMNSPCGWSWVDNKTAALSGPGVNLYAECADGVLLLATPFNTLTGTKETIVPGGHIHVWSDWVTNGVTCTSAGTRTRTCTAADCPIKTETQTVPKLGHDWLAWEVTKPATETETGTKTRSCSRCTATETETIPATGGGDTPSSGNLPDGFTEVEYVDTGVYGGVYFDSGVVGQYQVLVSAKVWFNESQLSDNYQWLIGSTGDKVGNMRCDPFYINAKQVNMTSRYTYNGPNNVVETGKEYTIESYTGEKGDYDSVYLKLNGQNQTLTRKVESTYVDDIPSEGNGRNMYVGIRQQGDAYLVHSFCGRIYYLQIKVGGNLVRDYVPCVSNNVAGLYDLVKGKFYPSLKNPFTAGPAKENPTPPAHEHAFGDWTTNAAPTCVKTGARSRFCACGEKETETLPKLEHDYQWVTTTPATATTAGEKQNKCTHCGDVKETTVIPATGGGDTPTGRNLPAPFEEVEYVDTGDAGGAYIDTGIVGQYKLWLSAKFSVHTTSARCWLMGSTADNQAHQLCDPFYTSYGQIFVGASYTFTGPKNKVVADKTYTVETYTGEKDRPDSVYLKFDNEQVNLDYTLSSSVTKIADEGNGMTLYLGARQEGKGRATNLFKGRVYSVQLKVGGELVRDYVPCVSNEVAGLYDFVKEKFYPSIGPKPFNAGPKVTPPASDNIQIGENKNVAPEKVFDFASSQAAITYPIEPTLKGTVGQDQIIEFGGKSVSVPTWFTATQSGNVISLEFTGKGAEPVIASEGSVPAFELTDDGTVKLHIINEKSTLWYAVGSKTDLRDSNEKWVFGDWQKNPDFESQLKGDRCFYMIRVRDYK